jgi:hypothetical protein
MQIRHENALVLTYTSWKPLHLHLKRRATNQDQNKTFQPTPKHNIEKGLLIRYSMTVDLFCIQVIFT